jgi:mycothiol synthase
MLRIELRTHLDEAVLAEILSLIDECTRIEGHRPVGEHKYSHLAVGATGWVGVLAHDEARLVGYAHTRWNAADARPRTAVEVVVHPDYRGGDGTVARRLLSETRGVLARAGGGLLYLWVHRVEDADETLAARMGFTVQRELAFMQRPLDEPPAALDPPEGVLIRSYRPGLDDAEFLRVNNAAFGDHPENGNWDRAELAERRARDWFDPDGVLMAWRGDRLLGFHWTKWHAHDSDEVPAHEPVGEVYVLAVDPEAHGLGLGRVLLVAGLRHLHARDCRQAILYVDCANTGAVGLYEANGFSHAYREVCYEERVPPEFEGSADDLRRPAF